MGKIALLEKSVANKISAGEVVEKPASVVKELVENSLDAGADSIIIEISSGGIDKISITDNGCGIDSGDVALAFMPHATSKIKSALDLESIATLGFRGEALASISAVSEVTLTTKTANESLGTFLQINGGEIISKTNQASNTGTKIIIKNLFFNTPARRKFLRKPKTEESDITRVVEKFLLSKPNIKFKYLVDGKLVYNTIGSGCYDNIYTIYGAEIANNVVEVNYSNNKFRLSGFIGKPEISKPNRTYQTLFINGRMVVNFLISNAVQTGYSGFLMKGQFPFYILNLELPFDSVDVNVHPSKQEVKFEHTSEIFNFFVSAISETLTKTSQIKSLESLDTAPTEEIKLDLPSLGVSFGSSFKSEGTLRLNSPTFELSEIRLDEISTGAQNLSNIEKLNFAQPKPVGQTMDEPPSFLSDREEVRVVGTVFATYIIVEKGQKIYFIDQHACHERKKYDALVNSLEKNEVITQDLLFPFTFSCNTEESQFFNEHKEVFDALGFSLEEFGNKIFQITRVPFLLEQINLGEFINEVKSNLFSFSKSKHELLKDFLAKKACKSASKAGDKLSQSEIECLLTDLNNLKTLLCPHGRPIVVEVSKTELEKWFKRIV